MILTPRLKMLVQRVFADARMRAAFLMNPEEVLAAHSVSTAERRALFRLHTRLAAANSTGDVSLGPLSPWP